MENSVSIYQPTQIEKNKFLSKTYLWMALALFISALAAWFCANSSVMLKLIFGTVSSSGKGAPIGFIVLCILEFALVIVLSAKIRTLSIGAAVTLFLLYAVVNGMTLCSIFVAFKISSIAYCFTAATVMFAIMAIFGATTKKNLSSWGYYLTMGLIGVIIVSLIQYLVSFLTHTSFALLDMMINIVVIVIFTGLTAYDNQRIMKSSEHADSGAAYQKLAIYAALQLYLDFINIFLRLLRIFGKAKD